MFDARAAEIDSRPIVTWFESGGTLDLADTSSAEQLIDAVDDVDGFEEALSTLMGSDRPSAASRAAAADFILEGLCALRKISRTEGGQLFAPAPQSRPRDRQPDARSLEQLMEEDDEHPRGRKKKFYN